jgi:hypothetical protein
MRYQKMNTSAASYRKAAMLIVLLIIEKIRGVPLAQKTQEIVTWIGLILLLSVFLWVTYNDILRWVLPGR